MAPLLPRIHFYEIDDQSWFPSFLREKVQAALTLLWTDYLPPFQWISPASLVMKNLQSILGPSIKDYTFIDFCSGAGGPTPEFEREVNQALRLGLVDEDRTSNTNAVKTTTTTTTTSKRKDVHAAASATSNGTPISSHNDSSSEDPSVDFILTDLFPHIPSWSLACARSPHLHYIPRPINATSTPPNLLSLTHRPLPQQPPTTSSPRNRKPFHLFSLAFHHFPNPPARAVLQNTLHHASGFAILELQSRTPSSLLTALCLGPLLWLVSWYQFWGDWTHLFFTYIIPIVPVVVVFDGLVSCMRMRDRGEILRLIEECDAREGRGWREGWRFESGRAWHTWPIGEATWFVGIKED
ncbi:MAG: hypothetical protein LQ350_000323 [Teloschistes chrysophthalmus]|nr:MAG: hypothetical protein LQ350_000323 [Niorma chrysophthalma]